MQPTTSLKIDFVSDVACPWCAIGLAALDQAIENLAQTHPQIQTHIHFQPFQLNPDMPPEGQDIAEHLTQKYGSTPEQQAQSYEAISQRGAALGFEFRKNGRGRTWNTFDCHRLLHWAGELGSDENGISIQKKMKQAMLASYFTEGQNPASQEALIAVVSLLGLDVARAKTILDSDEFTAQVRARQRFYHANNIHAVPAVIINDRHLISGGQPVEIFENALRQIAAKQESN